MKRFAVLVFALAGCGSPCPQPFFDGDGNDEAWRTMLDGEARARADDSKAIQVFFPADGAVISASGAPPKFYWTTPLSASRDPAAPRGILANRSPSWLSRAGGWVYSSAWAHRPPVTGPVHFLRIAVPNRACPLEVLTTRNEWTPNEAAWALLKTFTTRTLTFDSFSAYLQENRITEGPFHFSKPLNLTVAK